jgi:hypothetical protein
MMDAFDAWHILSDKIGILSILPVLPGLGKQFAGLINFDDCFAPRDTCIGARIRRLLRAKTLIGSIGCDLHSFRCPAFQS